MFSPIEILWETSRLALPACQCAAEWLLPPTTDARSGAGSVGKGTKGADCGADGSVSTLKKGSSYRKSAQTRIKLALLTYFAILAPFLR